MENNNKILKENSFLHLNKIDLSKLVKKKMGLTYLSWADAWNILKTEYPDAEYKIYKRTITRTKTETIQDENGKTTTVTINETPQEIPYFSDGSTCFVHVGVVVNGMEYEEVYPIIDLKNNSIKERVVTMVDVNKALQRAFVKACARHGLGLYIYRDLEFPETDIEEKLSGKDDFASVKADVIELVKAFSEKDQNYPRMVSYIQEMFDGQRLSTVEEKDLDKLLSAREHLKELLA